MPELFWEKIISVKSQLSCGISQKEIVWWKPHDKRERKHLLGFFPLSPSWGKFGTALISGILENDWKRYTCKMNFVKRRCFGVSGTYIQDYDDLWLPLFMKSLVRLPDCSLVKRLLDWFQRHPCSLLSRLIHNLRSLRWNKLTPHLSGVLRWQPWAAPLAQYLPRLDVKDISP